MISRSKIVSIGFLLLILIISLAISLFFPYVTVKQEMEGFQEGLLSFTDQEKINKIMQTYVDDIEAVCKASISGGSVQGQGLQKITWINTTESNAVMPIIQNSEITNTAKIDNINQLNPAIETPAAQTILQNCNASRYAVTVKFLNELQSLNIADDIAFTTILQEQIATTIPSGNNSSYNKIYTYLTSIKK